jgi:assimilatory nitrate reductase catalytic subunit
MATQAGPQGGRHVPRIGEGRIKALWIMATNPAVSMPDAGAVREALAACPFVVVSDVIAETDTSRFAHVRLPAAGWGEKDGTVTNSERRSAASAPFCRCPARRSPTGGSSTEVARRMGWARPSPTSRPADIWREHARLSPIRMTARGCSISRHAAIGNAAYDAMAPFRWGGRPSPMAAIRRPTARRGWCRSSSAARRAAQADWPMTLNTGRYRDQWHTMTRTGLSPEARAAPREPLVEIHPDDAEALGMLEGGLARVGDAAGREPVPRAR